MTLACISLCIYVGIAIGWQLIYIGCHHWLSALGNPLSPHSVVAFLSILQHVLLCRSSLFGKLAVWFFVVVLLLPKKLALGRVSLQDSLHALLVDGELDIVQINLDNSIVGSG